MFEIVAVGIPAVEVSVYAAIPGDDQLLRYQIPAGVVLQAKHVNGTLVFLIVKKQVVLRALVTGHVGVCIMTEKEFCDAVDAWLVERQA